MRRARLSLSVLLSSLLVATMLAPIAAVADEHDEGDEPRVLVFSATAGFRHASIPDGIAAVQDLGDEYGFEVDATEDASNFTDENLANYDAVVWLSTTGSVLNSEQQAAFESYIQNGGGYAGIHSASDTHYDWAWYGDLVGAYFDGHPPGTQTADIWVTDQAHPSTEMLPGTWERHDEWYDFNLNPRGDVHVLATIDETSYVDQVTPGPQMGDDHPIAWCQPFDGGRSWYTAGGHTSESFSEELFLEHMAGGILWAAGEVDGDCGGTVWDNYDKVVLDDSTSSPMMLEVADDGRVFYIERDGRVQVIDPDTNETTLAANLDVYTGQENGLLGITLDPDFDDNERVYLFHSPPNAEVGDDPVNRVSRFTMDGDTLDVGSEEVLIDIPHQRDECCHSAGDLEFGPDGELFISTGDDTNPFQSDNYAPIDEREGREPFDAQRSSANTNDLRGKVLRIVPTEDGSYEIPEGNLFEEGTEDTRPEIYVMGLRNPFRFSVDQTDGRVYLADYGPDAGQPNPDRGPQNHVTWHIIDEPANIGWPYCIGPNRAYIDYDFDTGESGEPFDCEGGPINDSPNNTGLTQTPPVQPATVWYNYSAPPEFPMLAGGAPMGGPRYEYDAELDSEVKWPASFDGSVVFGEWGANQIFDFNLNDDASDVTQITRMLPDMQFLRPMDFDFGPHDGALYMIEWGSGFGGNNTNSQVIRLEYTGVEDPDRPQVSVTADPTSGDAPLDVDFTGEATSPVGDDIVSYTWDFDDGSATADGPDASHTYEDPGIYRPTLSATDSEGRTGQASVRIDVEGDDPPPSGDLVCIGEPGEVVFTSDFDDGTTDGWVSASGTEQVAASDAIARSGDYSLLTTGRNQFYMGPERDVSDVVEPGGTYELSVWLRLPDGAGTADLDIISIVAEGGQTDFDNLGGVTVDDEAWTELTATWTLPDAFSSAAIKVEGLPATQDFHLDDLTVSGFGAGERPELHSDEFDGDQLDGCRWDRVVRYDPETLQVTGGQLLIETPPGDIYQTPNDPVTNLVLQTQPDGDWTVETRLEEELAGGFSQAGLMVYVDDDNYVKFDVIADDGQSEVNRIELRSEVDGQIVGPQENLDAPDNDGEWWLRLTKEGDDFTGQVSTDGEDWIDFPSTVTNEAAAEDGGVGLFTLGVNGPLTTVAFDYFRVDGEDVAPPPPPPSTIGDLVCLGDLSDDFSGDSLDTDRWSRIVREDAGAYSVGDGSLTITGAEADIYGTNANDAPNLILQPIPDPDGAWEATAQVTVEAYEAWQQAGLIVYGDDDNYAKMVLQGRTQDGPDPASRVFQFIREEGGNPNEVGDSNTDPLGEDYPDTVWVRFTSDGSDLNASYSADGVEFTEMPETKQMEGIEDPHIGLFAINPGPGPVIDADFHSFQFTPDPTAVRPDPSDEFDGDELDGCRWDRVVRYDPDAIEMTGGQLLIDTPPGDIFQDQDGEPTNFILQTQPDGDWTVQTRFTEELVTGFSQAGLMVYLDDDNYVKFDVIADANQTGVNRIELRSEVDGQIVGPEPDIEAPDNDGEWWLRLSKEGDSFSGEVSVDGETWIATDASVTHEAVAADGGVGIFTLANQDDSTVVAFDHFRVLTDDPDPTEPTVEASLDPADPDGQNGWYVSPVSISLSSDDDDATLEWRLVGAEDWTTWTEPVTVSDDGIYEIEYRATNEAGSSELGTVGFQLDQTPPQTTATVDGMTEGDAFVDEATVTLDAEDATSGVAETHIREAGDDDFDVYDAPVTYTGEGSYTVEFRSADVAGNVEDWQSVSFEIVEDEIVDPPPSDVCARHQGGATFPDAPGSGHRFFIDCLAELGIVQGYDDGTFGPRDDVSRGQLASFVVRSIELATGETMEAGGELFPDVGVNSTHGPAIYKLRNAGVIQGYTDGTFRPRDSVSRDQTARYVVNALELVLGEELPRSGASFSDVAAGSQYASDIDALVTAGVVTGFTDGTFGPRLPVTRAQMTRFIGNSLEVLADEGAYAGP